VILGVYAPGISFMGNVLLDKQNPNQQEFVFQFYYHPFDSATLLGRVIAPISRENLPPSLLGELPNELTNLIVFRLSEARFNHLYFSTSLSFPPLEEFVLLQYNLEKNVSGMSRLFPNLQINWYDALSYIWLPIFPETASEFEWEFPVRIDETMTMYPLHLLFSRERKRPPPEETVSILFSSFTHAVTIGNLSSAALLYCDPDLQHVIFPSEEDLSEEDLSEEDLSEEDLSEEDLSEEDYQKKAYQKKTYQKKTIRRRPIRRRPIRRRPIRRRKHWEKSHYPDVGI
jgi:hypothetical protein